MKPSFKFYKKQNPDDVPCSGNSHKTITTKDHLKMDKLKNSQKEFPFKSYMKKDTDNVYSSISHPKSLIRQKAVIKFDNTHRRSTSKDHLNKGKLKNSQMEAHTKINMKMKNRLKMVKLKLKMESLTKFYMRKSTDDAPSSGRHSKSTTSVSLTLDQSPHAAEKVLKYKRRSSTKGRPPVPQIPIKIKTLQYLKVSNPRRA